MPSTRADLLPQMKRDYQALALANSLDPKRFMKGGGRANKVPEHFAVRISIIPVESLFIQLLNAILTDPDRHGH
jgi:hypothetical protein